MDETLSGELSDAALVPLTPDMLDACVDVYIDTFSRAPWYDEYESRQQVVDFFLNHLHSGNFVGYALKRGAEIVALSLGMRKPWIKGAEYYIDEFCVRWDAQGRGLGSLFLRLIERDIRARGMNAMILCTEKGFPAEGFYLRNGFKQLEGLIFLAR